MGNNIVGLKLEMSGVGHVTQPWEKQGITKAEWEKAQLEIESAATPPEEELTDGE